MTPIFRREPKRIKTNQQSITAFFKPVHPPTVPSEPAEATEQFLSENSPSMSDMSGPGSNKTSENIPTATSSHGVVESHEENEFYDLGECNLMTLTPSQRFKLATQHTKPPVGYKFPFSFKKAKNKKTGEIIEEKRYVRQEHLERYPWLVFSRAKLGLLCLPCALFMNLKTVKGQFRNFNVKNLLSVPLKNFNKLTGKDGDLEKHSQAKYHKECAADMDNFIKNFREPSGNVANLLISGAKERATYNRKMLSVAIDGIITCGKQGIGLRGHRDSGPLGGDCDSKGNSGNFRLLDYIYILLKSI